LIITTTIIIISISSCCTACSLMDLSGNVWRPTTVHLYHKRYNYCRQNARKQVHLLAQAHVLRMCGMSVVCETIYSHKHRRSLSAKRRSVLLLRVYG